MERKKFYMNELKDIQNMINDMNKLYESIRFNEDDEYENDPRFMNDEYENGEDECVDGECDLGKMKGYEEKEADPEEGLRELGEVDKIREIALSGMIKLCHNPEDDRYQALKKIFQFCDKAAENKDKTEEK